MTEDLTVVHAVVIEDRHSDVEVELFTDPDKAASRAQSVVDEYGDPDEADDEDNGLNDSMRAAGWTFYARYSCEGDSVRVQPLEVR